MNKGKFKVIALFVVAALFLSLSAAYVYSADEKCVQRKKAAECKIGAGREMFYKDLNLSEAQKKQLEENKNKHRDEMKALFNAMKETKASFRGELQKSELNMSKVSQLNNELKKLTSQMLDQRLAGIIEVRKILTPEQFKKFMAKMEKRMDRFGQREIDKK